MSQALHSPWTGQSPPDLDDVSGLTQPVGRTFPCNCFKMSVMWYKLLSARTCFLHDDDEFGTWYVMWSISCKLPLYPRTFPCTQFRSCQPCQFSKSTSKWGKRTTWAARCQEPQKPGPHSINLLQYSNILKTYNLQTYVHICNSYVMINASKLSITGETLKATEN